MIKDKDLMSDTGGSMKHRDNSKPSRSKGKERNRNRGKNNDPDFHDVRKDPDLRVGSSDDIAEALLDIAREILDEEGNGEDYLS